jgi:hypothetical protein
MAQTSTPNLEWLSQRDGAMTWRWRAARQPRILGAIGDRRAARLDAGIGTERNKFHAVPSLVPPVGIEPT